MERSLGTLCCFKQSMEHTTHCFIDWPRLLLDDISSKSLTRFEKLSNKRKFLSNADC